MTTPTITVEAAFNVGGTGFLILDDAAEGLLDTGALGPDNVTFIDISDYVRKISITRGRQRQLERYRAGSCSIVLDNRDGRFDPTNLSGPYVTAGVTSVRPGRPIRVRATWSGVTYDLFYGYADSFDVKFVQPHYSEVTVSCTDGFKLLGAFDGLAQAEQGGGELPGQRIARILDNAGWPGSLRQIDVGRNTLAGTTLAQNALSELYLTADSDNGVIYMGPDGKFVFEQGYSVLENTRSNTSQATFGVSGSDLKYHDIAFAYDDELVKNSVAIARVDGTQQTSNDVESQALYGVRTYERTDLLFQDDSLSTSLAGWLVSIFKDAELRVDSIVLMPGRDGANLWPQALGRQLRDRVTVKVDTPDGRTVTREVFVEGVTHTIDASKSERAWRTEFLFSSASAFADFLVLDSSSFGVLDTNVLVN